MSRFGVVFATGSHPLVRNKTTRDAALAGAHALESAQLELQDALRYVQGVNSTPCIEAIEEAHLIILRARDMLNIAIRRIPT